MEHFRNAYFIILAFLHIFTYFICISSKDTYPKREIKSRSGEFHFGDSLMLFHVILYPRVFTDYLLSGPPVSPICPYPHLAPMTVLPSGPAPLPPNLTPYSSVPHLQSGPHSPAPNLAPLPQPTPVWATLPCPQSGSLPQSVPCSPSPHLAPLPVPQSDPCFPM